MTRPLEPARPGAVRLLYAAPYLLLLWALRIVAAVLMTYPFSAVVSRTIGAWPQGDALLFEPGSLMLLEVYRLHRGFFITLTQQAGLLTLALLPLSLVATTLLLVALAHRPQRALSPVIERAAHHLTCIGLLYLGFTLASALVAAMFWVVAQARPTSIASLWGERAGDVASWGVMLLGGLVVTALGIVHDLARASVVRGPLDTVSALSVAFRTAAKHPLESLFAYWARAAASVLLALGAVVFATRYGVIQTERLWLVALLDGLVLLLLVVLRASWLGRALQLVSPLAEHVAEQRRALQEEMRQSTPAPASVRAPASDTAARSDARPGPSPSPDASRDSEARSSAR